MAKYPTRTRVASTRAVRDLLTGSQIHATVTLENCGISPKEIRKLVRNTQKADFDSGMYKESIWREKLSRKIWIVAAEMFFQINRCKRAIALADWADAIECAWLLGEARGTLFRMTAQQQDGKRSAMKSASKKNDKWVPIMEKAKSIHAALSADSPDGKVKVDYLYLKVRDHFGKAVKEFPGRSTFAARWSGLQSRINSN